MDSLREAVSKIKSGDKSGGRRLLVELVRSEPQNEQAWLWLAVTFSDPQKRADCLRRVLRINPENQNALKMLRKMDQESLQTSPAETPEVKSTSRFSQHVIQDDQQTSQSGPMPTQDPEPESPSAPPFMQEAKPVWEPEPESESDQDFEESKIMGSEEDQQRSLGELFRIWVHPLRMTEAFFRAETRFSNLEDTLISVFVYTITAVLFSMIASFFQLQNLPLEIGALIPNPGTLVLILLLGSVILTPVSFFIQVGIQFLGARIFGGNGTYLSQAYLQGLIQVPFTVLGGLISLAVLIPFVGFLVGLLGIVISFYGLVVNIRALKAVHDLSTGRAVAALIVPPFLIMLVLGCVMLISGSMFSQLFSQIPG